MGINFFASKFATNIRSSIGEFNPKDSGALLHKNLSHQVPAGTKAVKVDGGWCKDIILYPDWNGNDIKSIILTVPESRHRNSPYGILNYSYTPDGENLVVDIEDSTIPDMKPWRNSPEHQRKFRDRLYRAARGPFIVMGKAPKGGNPNA